jgi:hypothetical protein
MRDDCLAAVIADAMRRYCRKNQTGDLDAWPGTDDCAAFVAAEVRREGLAVN